MPDSTQRVPCGVIQSRWLGTPHPTRLDTSTIAGNGVWNGTRCPRVRNRTGQCDVIGNRLVVCPRPRRLVELVADLLSRIDYT
jgi:hypothetical protein